MAGLRQAPSGKGSNTAADLERRFPQGTTSCEGACVYDCEKSGRVIHFTLGPKLPSSPTAQ